MEEIWGAMGRSRGALLLATVDGAPAGCVGVRLLAQGCCEMKRLAERAMTAARVPGYTCVRRDTLPPMQGAQAL